MIIKDGFVLFFTREDMFSNWYPSEFITGGVRFCCMEQHMMYSKAFLFGDQEVMEQILLTTEPGKMKALGRKVKNYDEETWVEHREEMVYAGLRAKFDQNRHLKDALLATEGNELVEASPYDVIWGIGFSQDDPRATDKSQWRGKNLLGVLLTRLREEYISEGEND